MLSDTWGGELGVKINGNFTFSISNWDKQRYSSMVEERGGDKTLDERRVQETGEPVQQLAQQS